MEIERDRPMQHRFSRRQFLKVGGAGLLLPLAGCRSLATRGPEPPPIRMGVIADLHHGLEPRAMERLNTFMQEVDERRPDCILQLGDFNFATPDSRECMDLWRSFEGARYHVLGNHDMDFTTKEETVAFWSMPARFYSFDLGGYHFVVLDRNNLNTPDGYVPYARANFYVESSMRGYADPEQLEWLRDDLLATRLPTVVFAHQGLGRPDGANSNSDAARALEFVLEQVNEVIEGPGVVACFCGHHHVDRYYVKNNIYYVWINSASYYWVGDQYGRMAPYRDALFAFVTFRDGLIEIEGRATEFETPTPRERGFPRADELNTHISDRKLRFDA